MNQTAISSMLLWTILYLTVVTCDKGNEEVQIDFLKFKQIAWNSLSESEQEMVLHDWIEAEASLTQNPNAGEDVILVIFHTPYDALTCPIRVFIDIETEKVIYPENIPKCN